MGDGLVVDDGEDSGEVIHALVHDFVFALAGGDADGASQVKFFRRR